MASSSHDRIIEPKAFVPHLVRLTYSHVMFGPLNGARVALVALAFVAGMAAFIVGYPWVALVLLAGVAIHGLGWAYLYKQRVRNGNPHT